jgi:hypothetical protein
MLVRFLGGALLILLSSIPCGARVAKTWSHDEMQKAADLIVIAKPVKSERTAARLDGYESAVGMNSTFDVRSTLKGALDGKLVVQHYVFAKGGMVPPNAPTLVSFPTGEHAATYLLFLKKNADGTCEPITGQIDPISSWYILSTVNPEWTEQSNKSADADEHAGAAKTEWLAGILKQISEIKPGVTRKDFENIFVVDGGLSSRAAERYCYRQCPWIKVDVAFKVAAGSKASGTDPEAKLTRISKPYLETPCGD